MGMLCSQCRTATLDVCQPQPELEALRCNACGGLFIASARYFAFLAASCDGPGESSLAPAIAAKSHELKLCPACGKFMHYYPVGHGLRLGIDKCNTCGGVWLNAGIWEQLRQKNAHRKLHAISSDVWQERVQRQQRAEAGRSSLLRRLGADDLAKLESVSAWVQNHPHYAEILAYLQRPMARL